MNQDERAALERLLEYVGRGFCAVQSDCKMLREYLETSRYKYSDDLSAALNRGRELLNGGAVQETQHKDVVIVAGMARIVRNVAEMKNRAANLLGGKRRPQAKKPKPKARKKPTIPASATKPKTKWTFK